MNLKFFMFVTFLVSGLIAFATSCNKQYPPTDMTQNSIIPKPVSVIATNGTFVLDNDVDIYVDAEDEGIMKHATLMAEMLRSATGFGFEIKETDDKPWRGNIYLTKKVHQDTLLEEGGYLLDITEKSVTISAPTGEGIFYGIQTLRQLLPSTVETPGISEEPYLLPTGIIRDWPHYAYRGVMLDVARHFFGIETVKRVIDYLAFFKMNVLHLHLSDDQGWRIEIEAWPNLTKHGGSTQVGGGEGGYYTKDEYKEIIQYAAERHITIVPEIDMPGHTNAALASYPELNCDEKALELYSGTRVGFSTLCTNKEVVYDFVDDVVREISEMTPGPYFHIGGDESHSTKHGDYVYFVNRAREIVKLYDKQMIGWDEVAHAEVNAEDVVQFWSKEENALLGVSKGAKVIMSPSKHAYMDMKYREDSPLGLDWAGLTEVEDAYNWDPGTLVEGVEKIDIIGVEAPLWSETIEDLDDIEYLMFPRLPGYAEIGWTTMENRSWEDYKVRLGQQQDRFRAMGIDFYESPLVPWQEEQSFFMDVEITDEVVE
jgi:hexosaminidase